ncbi:hypothetical protein [Lentisalinibacter sediminis]|uniref:hypothetical protein n=1 Tax=Lentisalinibacter sediminis TaxID=2992237 RepID=UPI00386318C4
MPRVVARPDNLDQRNREFGQRPMTAPVFLNSVPKSGTHLLRNIMRMFVPVEQQYHRAFIQYPILRDHMAAFSRARPYLSWGHLLYADDSAIALRRVQHLLLVRDPYDWVLARARFFLSDNFQGSLDHLKGGNVAAEDMLNMMIFGIPDKAPTLREIYTHNAVAWLGTSARLLRFEELLLHVRELDTSAAGEFFAGLLAGLGMGELPDDWRERVRVGADRSQSGTARENLVGTAAEVPDELPDTQKRLVDYAAPGLRALLGYE